MDTRCADPDLQLDVDFMILEYTLYHAVEERLQSLHVVLQGADAQAHEHNASRLLRIFDSYVQLFGERHPNYDYPPDYHFRLDILEFSMLLSGLPSISEHHLSAGMLERLQVQGQEEIKARRRWQDARWIYLRRLGKTTTPSPTGHGDAGLEHWIYTAWAKDQDPTSTFHSEAAETLILFSLLSRFMTILAKFSDLIDQRMNQSSMQLASEFMLQASLESLRFQVRKYHSKYLPYIEDCFAWGYTDPIGSTSLIDAGRDDREMMEFVNKMFGLPAGTSSSSNSRSEDPAWTQLRMDTLREFSIPMGGSISSQNSRLDRLSHKYPRTNFVQKLLLLMQNIWELSCQDDCLGEPVLCEIEKGHLRSFDLKGLEFEKFASRVGLLRSLDGPSENIAVGRRFAISGLLLEQSLVERYKHERPHHQ